MKLSFLYVMVAGCIFLSACSKPEPAVEDAPPPPPPQTTFAFTETNTVVVANEIESADDDKKSLAGDFNMDGLSDLAVISQDGDSQNKVDIYIQKKPDPEEDAGSSTSSMTAKYFKGGSITRPDGKIIGIASAVEKRIVNIIILVTHSNQPNEWIHYRNDGNSFTEVEF